MKKTRSHKLPDYSSTDYIQAILKAFGYPKSFMKMTTSKITKFRYDKKKGVLYFE